MGFEPSDGGEIQYPKPHGHACARGLTRDNHCFRKDFFPLTLPAFL